MNLDDYLIREQPYYSPTHNEVALFEAALANRIPMMLKGPTGCGKTRFVEYIAWKLKKPLINQKFLKFQIGLKLFIRLYLI